MKFSLCIPMYNESSIIEDTARQLSAYMQANFDDYEIIFSNDGSKDGTAAIADAYVEKYPTIVKAVHKPNGGLSDARNHGLERACGEYICFVDSDDWCDLRFVELLLRQLQETGSDLTECGCLRTDGHVPDTTHISPECRVYEGRDCFLRFLSEDFSVSVCNKLYRRSLLENLPFRRGVYHEDEFWTYQIFSKARRVCRLNYTGYYYYQRQGSIVHTKPSEKRITDAFTAGKERVDFYYQRPGSIVHTRPSEKRLRDAFDAARERICFVECHYPEYAAVGYTKMMYTCMYLYSQAGHCDPEQRAALQEELYTCFCGIFKKYLRQGQSRKEMWRFCCFRLHPSRYCSRFY